MKKRPQKREPTEAEMEVMLKEQAKTLTPSPYNLYQTPRRDMRNRQPNVRRQRVLGTRRKHHAE